MTNERSPPPPAPILVVDPCDIDEDDLQRVDREISERLLHPKQEGFLVGGGLKDKTLSEQARKKDAALPYFNDDRGTTAADAHERHPLMHVLPGDYVRLVEDAGLRRWLVASVGVDSQQRHLLHLEKGMSREGEIQTRVVFGRLVSEVEASISVRDRDDGLQEGMQLYCASDNRYYTVTNTYDYGCVLDPRQPEEIYSMSYMDYSQQKYVPNLRLYKMKRLGNVSRKQHEQQRRINQLQQEQQERRRSRQRFTPDGFPIPATPAAAASSAMPVRAGGGGKRRRRLPRSSVTIV